MFAQFRHSPISSPRTRYAGIHVQSYPADHLFNYLIRTAKSLRILYEKYFRVKAISVRADTPSARHPGPLSRPH